MKTCQKCGQEMQVERQGWETSYSGLSVYRRVYLCACGWRQHEFNPDDIEVRPLRVTR